MIEMKSKPKQVGTKKPIINVVDAPCGVGKTTAAIQMMGDAENAGKRWLFVTPYKKEVDRIMGEVGRTFHRPEKSKGIANKTDALKALLEAEKNIVCTHSLFRRLDYEAKEMIRLSGYTLVLDEVFNVLDTVPLKPRESSRLIKDGMLKREGDKILKGPVECDLDRYHDIIALAAAGRLISYGKETILWQFPADSFSCFEDVWLLTFLYDGQLQKAFYAMHGFKDKRYSVNREGDKTYFIPSIDKSMQDSATHAFAERLKENLNVYEGRSNAIGDTESALSVSWYGKNPKLRTKLKANCGSAKKMLGANAKNALFTCWKKYKDKVAPPGFGKDADDDGVWIAHSKRATNQFRDRTKLFYLVNRYMKPPVKKYLEGNGCRIDEELFALSELLQWICRSALRDDKPVDLYLPSYRMRRILYDFIG